MAQIKNIIFDLGNVLVHCDLDRVSRELSEQSDRPIGAIRSALENDRLFHDFDEGLHTGETFTDAMRELVGWKGTSAELEGIWQRMLFADERMFELMDSLLESGYKVYILSNANPFHVGYVKETFPKVLTTHGQIFSCECRMIKPNDEIFHHTRTTFGVEPSETVFIDDRPVNIDASKRAGFVGILHESYEATVERLLTLLDGFGVG